MKPAIRLLIVALIGLALIEVVFPMYWTLLLSFKTYDQAFASPPLFVFEPTTKNYEFILGRIGPYLGNSLMVAAGSTFLSVAAGTLGAYAFSRFSIWAKDWVMFLVLSALMLPPIVIAVPLFFLATTIGINGSLLAIMLAHALFNTPFVVWMMRAFFDDIPRDLDDAALVDGATPSQSFWHVSLPLAAPGLVATSILAAFYSWNEFLLALVLSARGSQTLPVYIASFQRETTQVLWGELGAAIVLALLPLVVFTLAIQRYLVRGLTFGAVKG